VWKPNQLTIEQRQGRRLEAARLLQEGQLAPAQIAQHLGVCRHTVNQWAQQLNAHGCQVLHRRPKPGRKPHLDSQQWQQLLQALQKGAQAAGFASERWTLRRIQYLLWQQLGVRYHAHYLSAKLPQLGWSVQKPAVDARQGNDELVEAWLKRDWPRLQKKLASWEPA
jgi:putative transposase